MDLCARVGVINELEERTDEESENRISDALLSVDGMVLVCS